MTPISITEVSAINLRKKRIPGVALSIPAIAKARKKPPALDYGTWKAFLTSRDKIGTN